MLLLRQWQESNDSYSCGFGFYILFFAFSITFIAGFMDWSPTGANQNQDFILSLFILTIIDCPENRYIDKLQATNNQWMLPVGYLANLWSFLLFNHHESHIEGSPKQKQNYFYLSILLMFITTQKSSSAKKRSPQTLLPLFKPKVLPVLGMVSPQQPSDNPHQTQFDSDSQKFLINSGASVHMWAQRKNFISYCVLTNNEQERDQVLGVCDTMIKPLGISSVKVLVKDDQSDIHTLHLNEVHHIPSLPINTFVPQVFVQQRQQEGDINATCTILAQAMTLQWTSAKEQIVEKCIPLNKSNIGFCLSASGYK